MSKHTIKVSKTPRLKCNQTQRHQKQTTIKNNKKMDLGKADIETIWRYFSHTKMNAVKEHHTCEKTAEESHNHDKSYSIEPWRRQSKIHLRVQLLWSIVWLVPPPSRVRSSLCTSVTPAVLYMLTGLARCLVSPGISCGARKLARTPRVIQKKKKYNAMIGVAVLDN